MTSHFEALHHEDQLSPEDEDKVRVALLKLLESLNRDKRKVEVFLDTNTAAIRYLIKSDPEVQKLMHAGYYKEAAALIMKKLEPSPNTAAKSRLLVSDPIIRDLASRGDYETADILINKKL